ncbi:MAG: DUF2871 domain-containing protein [Atopobiaceae bacterium]|jgi:hypothetical protein|nr:DUF2871 domain-containing protein [Atopobiaceae bacterium]MCH4180418.1 DUF2871 domain-containing protein [Atopobiaceae bacterium]MCH4214490.1 DUF2871 domain-containing protein [Atopobiaceae bacterium]MCH4230444.1 DUF2871 domain-containing protein [Atopobiaceae bacterium]MCH4276264.1 DUF2871 domain-containing protein [Atopobiaceae bacterium]
MRKYLNIALGYAIAAMVGGVFYREFTKWNGFTGVTALGKVHVHLFLLGMLVFLLVALFSTRGDLARQKTFRAFMVTYNIGVPLMAVMLVVRGVPQVLGLTLSVGVNGAISGIAGVAHILVGVGIVLLIVALKANERGLEAGVR